MSDDIEKYTSFFEDIKKFKIEQEKQKQRGLNNYNILTTVLRKSDEVRLHSRMIFSFLNPNGSHYQSSLFLDKFLQVLNVKDFEIDVQNCSVYKEYKNIDLYITDGNKHIIIENKVYASEQKNQIKRYIEIIQNENMDLDANDILVVYLTIDKKEPSPYSLGDLQIKDDFVKLDFDNIAMFKAISYRDDVLKWLKLSQYEVQNITNLNEVFNQYIDVIKMISNKYKDKVMSLADYIRDNESIYKMAVEVHKELPKARENKVEEFFSKIIISLQSKLGQEYKVEKVGDLSKRYSFPLRIYKKKWIGSKGNNLIFGFEFNRNNYYDGYFGVVRKNNKVDIKNDIVTKFKERLEALQIPLETSIWWLHWEWLPMVEGAEDFAHYIMFNKNAEEEFVKGILFFIEQLESKNSLMTDINHYLNKKAIEVS